VSIFVLTIALSYFWSRNLEDPIPVALRVQAREMIHQNPHSDKKTIISKAMKQDTSR